MGDFEEKNQESENLITDVSSEETSNENYNNDIDVTDASEGAFHKPPAFFTLRRMMQAGPLRSVIRASRMDALQMR